MIRIDLPSRLRLAAVNAAASSASGTDEGEPAIRIHRQRSEQAEQPPPPQQRQHSDDCLGQP
jgi:hypothetical protein